MTIPNPTDLRQAVARIVDSEAMRTLEEWEAIDKRLPVVLPLKVMPWPQARFLAYASSRELTLAKADAIHALYTARIDALTAEPGEEECEALSRATNPDWWINYAMRSTLKWMNLGGYDANAAMERRWQEDRVEQLKRAKVALTAFLRAREGP